MVPSRGVRGSLTWVFEISQFTGTALFYQKNDRTIDIQTFREADLMLHVIFIFL